MTDQPTTQERCPTCDSKLRAHRGVLALSNTAGWVFCSDAWHAQDVEVGDAPAAGAVPSGSELAPAGKRAINDPAKRASSTTQEAEKALEDFEIVRRGLGKKSPWANRENREALSPHVALERLRTQYTKDREEIERLKARLEREEATSG